MRLLTAMEGFLSKGFHFSAITVEQLMEEAGMTRGTFYKHFRDKGELVARLMGVVTEEIARSTGPFYADALHSDPRNMRKAVVEMVRTFKKHQAVFAAINHMAPHDPTVAMLYRKMIDSLCYQSRVSLTQVKANGKGRTGVTPDVVDVLTKMVVLYCSHFVGELEGKDIDRLTRSLGYICTTLVFADSA